MSSTGFQLHYRTSKTPLSSRTRLPYLDRWYICCPLYFGLRDLLPLLQWCKPATATYSKSLTWIATWMAEENDATTSKSLAHYAKKRQVSIYCSTIESHVSISVEVAYIYMGHGRKICSRSRTCGRRRSCCWARKLLNWPPPAPPTPRAIRTRAMCMHSKPRPTCSQITPNIPHQT